VGGFTKTELSPPDLVMGRTSIALAFCYMLTRMVAVGKTTKTFLKLTIVQVCVIVCVSTSYMCHCVRMSVHVLAHIRCLDILLLETRTSVVAMTRFMWKQI